MDDGLSCIITPTVYNVAAVGSTFSHLMPTSINANQLLPCRFTHSTNRAVLFFPVPPLLSLVYMRLEKTAVVISRCPVA